MNVKLYVCRIPIAAGCKSNGNPLTSFGAINMIPSPETFQSVGRFGIETFLWPFHFQYSLTMLLALNKRLVLPAMLLLND